MGDGPLESASTGLPLAPESLLPSHRYVPLPPLGRRQILVSAPTRADRWRLARSNLTWGCSLHGRRRVARRALAALASAWCLLSPGRRPPAHSGWREYVLDRELRRYCEEASSMVIHGRGHGTHRVCGLATGPWGSAFIKVAEGTKGMRLLANEAQMLRLAAPACAPRLLRERIEADAGYLVVEAVRPDCRPPSQLPSARVMELLESLPRYGAEDVENHPWIRSILGSPECPPDMALWCKTLRGRRWPLVVFHADFMPYHLATRFPDEPVLIDWEYGSLGGFPGADAAIWAVNVGARHLRLPADAISSAFTTWACGRELGGVRVSPTEARAILALAAYFTYRAQRATPSEPEAQRVRAALWRYEPDDCL